MLALSLAARAAFTEPGLLGPKWYWVRAFPPARLPVFVMGMCCGLQRLHADQIRRAGLADPGPPAKSTSSQRCPMITVLAGCFCLSPTTGLVLYWLLFTLAGVSAHFWCWPVLGAENVARSVLELFFPILFYDLIYALTGPEAQASRVATFFSSRWMVFLGEISMCVYMIHIIVAEFLGAAVGKMMGQLPWWSVFAVVPTSLLLGWLLYRGFEQPCARRLAPGDKCGKHRGPRDESNQIGGKTQQQPDATSDNSTQEGVVSDGNESLEGRSDGASGHDGHDEHERVHS